MKTGRLFIEIRSPSNSENPNILLIKYLDIQYGVFYTICQNQFLKLPVNNGVDYNIDYALNLIDLFLGYRMYNILVIDDEESIVSMLTMALSKCGFNVETAADGLEGIKKFDECNFDLVITDIRMHALDGTGVVRHI